MDGFIGRIKELEHLNKLYARNVHTCCIYGRRRVGKSTLLDEFCKDKESLIIPFVEKMESSNLEMINSILSNRFSKHIKIKTLMEFLDILPKLFSGKAVVVFDEFSYISKAAPYFPSLVQHFIDRVLPETKIMLVLCSSSISSMTSEIDDTDRPLFGRFVNRMEIKPMSYIECKEFHKNMSDMDSLKVYMTVGGIPLYHRMLNYDTYDECIKNGFMGQYSDLSNEAEILVRRELSPYSTYSSMISIMQSGSVTIKEISEKLGVSRSLCSRYMKNMMMLDIAEKMNPMGDSPKEPSFKICDKLVGFYYEVIEPNKWLTNAYDKDIAFEKISHAIDTFLGESFESVCKEYISKRYLCKDIGNWYGWSGSDIEEIDIVAIILDNDVEYSMFGECKFRKKVVGMNVLKKLMFRSDLVKGLMNKRLILFSVSGFDDDLEEYAEDNNVILADLKTLYSLEL